MSEYDGLIADARAKIDDCDLLDAWDLMARLTDALVDTITVEGENYARLSRLHEVATERTVQLAGIIEKARALIDGSEWTDLNWRHARNEAGRVLATADTAPTLRQIRAKAWEEGRLAWARYELASEDAAASGQGHLVSSPVNPYRTEGSNDRG